MIPFHFASLKFVSPFPQLSRKILGRSPIQPLFFGHLF